MHTKMSSAKWQPFCQGRDELNGLTLKTKHGFIRCNCEMFYPTLTNMPDNKQLLEMMLTYHQYQRIFSQNYKKFIQENAFENTVLQRDGHFDQAFITRGQFWPSGIVVACVCVCVCVCLSVNHQLVRAVTHQPFKLESPNLDQRCKRPWLRSLLFF